MDEHVFKVTELLSGSSGVQLSLNIFLFITTWSEGH